MTKSLLMKMCGLKLKNVLPKHFLIWIGIPLLAWYVSSNWYQLMMIQGKSMEPAYHHMQIVLLDKHVDRYESGDVIAFFSETLGCVLVKRIAAGPGDTTVVCNDTLLVNGKLSTVYPHSGSISYPGILAEEIRLGSHQYLVLGDNLEKSIDSRHLEVGLISQEDILGKIYTRGK